MGVSGGANLPGPGSDEFRRELAERALGVLEGHRRPEGYALPNATTYPHQWLWDSCFHAVIWARLGHPERAVAELRAAFAHQGPDGFVPHMTYWSEPDVATAFWGRRVTSCLTQPPMYGHALAELARCGASVPDDLVAAAQAGLGFLLGPRREGPGAARGVRLVHPWESGCDDSPRWDGWCVDAGTGHRPAAAWSPAAWYRTKGELIRSLVAGDPAAAAGLAAQTGPVRNPAFEVCSAGFDALVAFNATELAEVTGQRVAGADEVAADLASRWDDETGTWVDVFPDGAPAGRQRTLDALLPALVVGGVESDRALDQLVDPNAFGSVVGATGVHRAEPCYDPDRYWRGPTWPQLVYLVWLAAVRAGRADIAQTLADGAARGALRSGWSEHWHPDTGAAQGAAPQSWTGLVALLR